jgi:hypothetical protein
MADLNEYLTLRNRWPLSENQRGSPELDALIDVVRAFTRQDRSISTGDYFIATNLRTAIPADDIFYRVIKTNAQYFVLEDLNINVDWTNALDGTTTISVDLYIDQSNRNTWTYTGGTEVKAGTSLNAEFINLTPDSDVVVGATVTDLTGDPDYRIYYTQTFIDISGNRNDVTTIGEQFFENNRKIIIPPSSTALLVTTTTGPVGSTVDAFSQLSYSQGTIREVY